MSYRVVEGTHWWAVRTRSNFERKVRDQLLGRRLEVFLPTYRKRSERKDRLVWLEAPLFSGYLFVRTDLSLLANRVNVLQARGLVSIVGGPDGPVAVPDFEIDNVRKLCESDRLVAPWNLVRQGAVVRVVSGGLAGVVGVVVEVRGRQKKIVCNVELLNRAVSAELGSDEVEVLDPDQYRDLRRKLLRGVS
jgi:transcription antitermination factor NusG